MTVKSSKTLIAEALKEIETLDSAKVKELHDKKECTLIDIRDIRELWNTGKVEGALHIPRGMLEFWLDKESPYYRKEKFQDNKKIILFCAAGSRSALATKTLKEMGFNNVAHIDGGFHSMQLEGFNIKEAEKE